MFAWHGDNKFMTKMNTCFYGESETLILVKRGVRGRHDAVYVYVLCKCHRRYYNCLFWGINSTIWGILNTPQSLLTFLLLHFSLLAAACLLLCFSLLRFIPLVLVLTQRTPMAQGVRLSSPFAETTRAGSVEVVGLLKHSIYCSSVHIIWQQLPHWRVVTTFFCICLEAL